MASTETSSESEPARPQAGPLPSKRGEIGYVGGVEEPEIEARISSPPPVLPARHPADRDVPMPLVDVSATNSAPIVVINALNPSPSSSTLVSSTTRSSAKERILGFLKLKRVPSYRGLLLTTLLAFICQLIVLGGTLAMWVVTTKTLSRRLVNATLTYLVHVLWGVAFLIQLFFLERRLYRLRAERYNFLNPNGMLPSPSHTGRTNIAFSPWNRPSLPTYAAALGLSGVGTGDVEDHLIAVPPPPAYGMTRGSTMVLTGHLRDSLRAQRPVSEHTQMGEDGDENERPVSYASHDDQWQEVQDAERALHLQETLSRLERQESRQ